MKEGKKRILIYRLGSLGDTIMALPCFNRIRQLYPDADITLLTNRPVATKAAPLEAVLGSGYFFDRVLDYPVGTRNPAILLGLAAKIRSLGIDQAINLMPSRSAVSSLRDVVFFSLAGVKQLTGFHFNGKKTDTAPSKGVRPEWEANRLIQLISKLGKININDDFYWDLHLTSRENTEAGMILEKGNIQHPVIAISLGTKNPANHWGDDNWQGLLNRLSNLLPNWTLLIIGADEERKAADLCLKNWKYNGMNLCGRISPRISAAILTRASLFIGHDSGPLHLAGCVGTPSVGIFSARNFPGRWFPRGTGNIMLYHLTDCAGCGLESCLVFNNKCIRTVTISEVEHAVSKILKLQTV